MEDRAKLGRVVQELQEGVAQRDGDLKLLARKHQLETKMLKAHLHQEQVKCKDLQKKLDAANIEITRLNLSELDHSNNGRNHFVRYRNLRETHSAATNMSYGHGLQVPSRSSSDSFYSKSPHCESYRNEILYEDQVAEEEDRVVEEQEYQHKIVEFEQQRRLHLQQLQLGEDEARGGAVEVSAAKEEDLVAKFETLNRKDVLEKEKILDSICDNYTNSSSPPVKKGKGKSLKSPDHISKKTIDPQSKTKLLAALKAIDGNDSFES